MAVLRVEQNPRQLRCPVGQNCGHPWNCAFCVDGSEYAPIDRKVVFPTVLERQVARKESIKAWKGTESYKGGVRSSRKGKRLEREAAAYFNGDRVPLSGALDGLPNDVVLRVGGWRAEVKGRANGFGVLYKWSESIEVITFPSVVGEVVLMRGELFQLLQDGVLPATWVVEARTRQFKQLDQWFTAEDAALLLLKADRKPWLVVLRRGYYDSLMAAAKRV